MVELPNQSAKIPNPLVSSAPGTRLRGRDLMAAEATSAVTRYALLIGVCFTPRERREEWKPLRGCVRDVREIEKHLAKLSPNVDIQTLTASLSDLDASCPAEGAEDLPTHSNVVSSLENIILRAPTGSFVYIHFTGHGTAIEPKSRFANRSTGELALVVLATDDQTKIQYLWGSELAYSLRRMVEKGLKVTLVLDCCASGSVVRDKADPSIRWLPYDPTIDAAHATMSGQSLATEGETAPPTFRGASMLPNWLIHPDGYAVLTACGPSEIAREIEVGAGKWHGALSYCLVRTFVNRGGVGGKLQHIYAHLCARFREKKVAQTPMLYGNMKLGFFGDSSPDGDAVLIPVIKNEGHGFQLGAGEAHGVHEGDKFGLCLDHRERGPQPEEQDAVYFQVTRVGPLMSDLKALGRTPTRSGMTAKACTMLALRKFRVLLDAELPRREVWELATRERPSLDIQCGSDRRPGISFSFHVIIPAEDGYEVRDESGRKIRDLPPLPYDLEVDADYVLGVLEHLAKFKLVENLANSSPADPAHTFRESFSVHLVDSAGKIIQPGCLQQGAFHPGCSHPECLADVEDGEELELVVRNKERLGGRDLLFYFFNLACASWEIVDLLQGNHEVIPPSFSSRHETDFPTGTTGELRREITMIVPDQLVCRGIHQCEDILKIFLTTQLTSFASLELGEIGEAAPPHRTSGERGPSSEFASQDWAALNFRIRTYLKRS